MVHETTLGNKPIPTGILSLLLVAAISGCTNASVVQTGDTGVSQTLVPTEEPLPGSLLNKSAESKDLLNWTKVTPTFHGYIECGIGVDQSELLYNYQYSPNATVACPETELGQFATVNNSFYWKPDFRPHSYVMIEATWENGTILPELYPGMWLCVQQDPLEQVGEGPPAQNYTYRVSCKYGASGTIRWWCCEGGLGGFRDSSLDFKPGNSYKIGLEATRLAGPTESRTAQNSRIVQNMDIEIHVKECWTSRLDDYASDNETRQERWTFDEVKPQVKEKCDPWSSWPVSD